VQALNQMDSETGQEFVKRLKERPREEQFSFIFFPIETRLQLYQIAERQRIKSKTTFFSLYKTTRRTVLMASGLQMYPRLRSPEYTTGTRPITWSLIS
jgi:hypothetical protein